MTDRDPWLECEPHLNQRLLGPMLSFYEVQFGKPALEKLASNLGTTLEVLRDPDRWFSTELFVLMLDEMGRATSDPDIAYRAGRALVWPEMMGAERLLAVGFATPKVAYDQIQKISSRLNKLTTWEVDGQGRGKARARVWLTDNSLDDPRFCRNRVAVLQAVAEGFNLPPARVLHRECIHDGHDACVYDISWVERSWLVPVGWVAVVLLGITSAVTLVLGSPLATAALAATAILAVVTGLGGLLSQGWVANEELRDNIVKLDEVEALLERNDRRIEELNAIQAVMRAAGELRSENELVDAVLVELRASLDYDRVLLLRLHGGGQQLGRARSAGFGEHAARVDALDLAAHTDGEDDRLFANVLASGQAALVKVDRAYLESLTTANRALLEGLGSTSFVAAPVSGPAADGERESIGLLVVDRTDPDRPLSLRDRDLLSSVAQTLGNAISNVRYLRDELLADRKFRQYLPAPVVERIRLEPEQQLQLGGEERELAVMFTDIADFTATSARVSADAVVQGLNAWFSITDPIIRECNGIVDKRMGDGILVVFLPETDARGGRHPALRAASAATLMQQGLEDARVPLAATAPAFGGMQVRHAIHFGRAIVGNMGSEERMEYTVIGDAVNVAARLEEITPAGEAYMTGEAVDAVSDELENVTLVNTVRLRGRTAETRVFRIEVEEANPTASGTWGVAQQSVTASLTAEIVAEEE